MATHVEEDREVLYLSGNDYDFSEIEKLRQRAIRENGHDRNLPRIVMGVREPIDNNAKRSSSNSFVNH